MPAGVLAATVATLGVLVLIVLVVVGAVLAARTVVRTQRRAPTGSGGERIDPFGVKEPWRRHVSEALSAQRRFREALATSPPGPVQDRLADLGSRVDEGVLACWRVARQGNQLDRGRARVDAGEAKARLARLEGSTSEADRATADALRARVETAERLQAVRDDADTRLRLLVARLDETVARAVEISLRPGDTAGELGTLDADVTNVVDELESLRLALAETSGS